MGSIYSVWRYNPQGNWAKMFIVYNLDLLSAASPPPSARTGASFCAQILDVGRPVNRRPTPIRAWSEHNDTTVSHMVSDHFMSSTQVTLLSLGTQRADSNEPMYHMYILD